MKTTEVTVTDNDGVRRVYLTKYADSQRRLARRYGHIYIAKAEPLTDGFVTATSYWISAGDMMSSLRAELGITTAVQLFVDKRNITISACPDNILADLVPTDDYEHRPVAAPFMLPGTEVWAYAYNKVAVYTVPGTDKYIGFNLDFVDDLCQRRNAAVSDERRLRFLLHPSEPINLAVLQSHRSSAWHTVGLLMPCRIH